MIAFGFSSTNLSLIIEWNMYIEKKSLYNWDNYLKDICLKYIHIQRCKIPFVYKISKSVIHRIHCLIHIKFLIQIESKKKVSPIQNKTKNLKP